MNPFSLSFGKEPLNVIRREKQVNEIVEGLTAINPEYQVCMLTGVRGSGKTVMMTEISSLIRKNKNWIVTELSPERDMLHALAAELSNRKELFQIFKDAKINLSILGFGVEFDSEPPITDVVIALDRMLAQLTKKGMHVLITLDEAVSNQFVREFASQFQIFMRKNYSVYLMMTGLYENIYSLQNQNTLTFLYRAPKFEMQPLNSLLVANQYQSVFKITEKESHEMAKLIQGYPYAYQVLGYLCYKHQSPYTKVIPEFDAYLSDYVYDKIWSETSNKDRDLLNALIHATTGKVVELRQLSNMSSNEFSVYRDRLIKKGIIKSDRYGYLDFTLPRFSEYIIRKDI